MRVRQWSAGAVDGHAWGALTVDSACLPIEMYEYPRPLRRHKGAMNRKLAGFFDRNLAGSKVGEVADGR